MNKIPVNYLFTSCGKSQAEYGYFSRVLLTIEEVFHNGTTFIHRFMSYQETWIPYDEQLKDERWLAIRSEVLARDYHMCTKCMRSDNLQVHHKYYETGKFAWEYPLEALVTLCRGCHAREHGIIPDRVKYEFRRYGESRPVLHISQVMIKWLEGLINERKGGFNG